MTMERRESSTWSMPARRAFMDRTRRCPIRPTTRWTIRSRCMLRRKSRTNCWRMPMRNSTTFRRRDYASLRSMARRVGPTWPISDLRTSWFAAKRSGYSITATASGTLPILMTSWRASCVSCVMPPNGRRVRMAFRCRPIWSTISATATRRICWTLWTSCNRNWCVPAYCLRTTISRRTRSWSRCSRVTCPSPMPIPPRWNGISASSQAPH